MVLDSSRGEHSLKKLRRVNRRGESRMEVFCNLAITPWLRLSADLQVVDPWAPGNSQATYTASRLQTKF
jgi:porin